MFMKSWIIFSAVVVMTLLTVEAKIFRPSGTMEREICTKNLSVECLGANDAVPFDFPDDAQGLDDACSTASEYFPCFKQFASNCKTDDVQNRYMLIYIEICDSSNPLYDGLRKSIACMKQTEKKFKETCTGPSKEFMSKMKAFGKKINDFGISKEDWKEIRFGLMLLAEQICYFKLAEDCNEEFEATMKALLERFGAKKMTDVLLEKQAIVEKIIDNLDLEDVQKTELKEALANY